MRRSLKHAFREQDTPNADPSRTPENSHIGAANVQEALARFNARLPDKVRSNAVLAVEYLITGSPEDMHGKSRQEQDAYFGDALKWLEERHGKENVVYAGIHRDETTPHMYAYVVPIDERGKLNCRAFLGGAKALNLMQTEFAQKVGQAHGLQRGIEGSKARHTSIQQYYARVNASFEPLPEVKTVPPKLRPEPEKPGLLAGKEAKTGWQNDHSKWLREKAVADKLVEQRRAEIKAQKEAAVATAKRHEAQAKEAIALKAKVNQLKAANSHYVAKAAQLEETTRKLYEVTQLFTLEEIKAAGERKRQQDAKKARQASEAARQAEIRCEVDKRVHGIPKLLQRSGAEHTFGIEAAAALKNADGNASKVDWEAVERETMVKSIGRYGQSTESVIKAILIHSPLRVDSASHVELQNTVNRHAPQLEKQYQSERAHRVQQSL